MANLQKDEGNPSPELLRDPALYLNADTLYLIYAAVFKLDWRRIKLFDTNEGKLIWGISYKSSAGNLSPKIVPFQLGRTLVYCAVLRHECNLYDLAAIKFRTGEMQYRVPFFDQDWRKQFSLRVNSYVDA